jgi:hypothetical protein
MAALEDQLTLMVAEAKERAAHPPAQWVCAVSATDSLAGARDAGARAGLAKALGREWAGCRARVVDLGADLGPDDAATALMASGYPLSPSCAA